MEKYDLIIVGAGPAGIFTAAASLQSELSHCQTGIVLFHFLLPDFPNDRLLPFHSQRQSCFVG